MSLWSRLSGLVKSNRQFSQGVSPTIITPNGISPAINDQSLVNRYRSWVYTCASMNGAAVGATPLRLYAVVKEGDKMPRVKHSAPLTQAELAELKESGRFNPGRLTNMMRGPGMVVEIFEHPFLDLMANPNPWRSQFELLEETTIYEDLTGDSYWLIDMDKVLGIPQSLNLLPSQYVRIVPDKQTFIKGYLFGRNSTQRQAFKEEQVIHYRYPNPRDQYYGMGCLEASIVASNQYDSMDTYETALNRNMGVPTMVVQYQGRLNRDDIPALESDWNRALKGMANSGKIKVTDQNYNVQQLSVSPREMGYMQGRKWSRNEIANAFGVPISMLDTENVNKANAQAGNEQYARRAIMPRLRRIEDRLNRDLIPLYNEPRIFCAFDNPVPEDDELQLKRSIDLAKSGIITRNEARAMQNIEPDPIAGDEYIQAGHPDAAVRDDSEAKAMLMMERETREIEELGGYEL